MSHFLLKFNYGVEVGAKLAYLGHVDRTKENAIAQIVMDECEHQIMLLHILAAYGQRPSFFITNAFWLIGNSIRIACSFCPLFMLDFVARIMETFAVINYSYLATLYPDFENTFRDMAKKELEHQEFFKRRKV